MSETEAVTEKKKKKRILVQKKKKKKVNKPKSDFIDS